MTEIFDLAVIGSGGGSFLADKAIESGHRLALIEGTGWGGTCLNRGCIPTKIMVHAADVIRESERASDIALRGRALAVDWPALKKRVFDKIAEGETMRDYYAPYPNIKLYKAYASFAGKEVYEGRSLFRLLLRDGDKEEMILAEKAVIANGGRTKVPEGIGLEETGYLSSERLFNPETWPEKLPESMILIGGGDIGVEFAHIFSSFGVKVDLVQHNVRLVPKHDHEISARLKTVLEKNGIGIHLNYDTVKAYVKDGLKHLLIRRRDSGRDETLSAEEFFVCPGIIPNSDTLNLDSISLETDPRGWIKTDEYLRTSLDGVYALGDINGRQQLRHKANYEGALLAENLLGEASSKPELRRAADYDLVPAGTFTALQLGTVGLTEERARAKGLNIKLGYLPFSATAQGYARGFLPGDEADGFAKIIMSEEDGTILGAHIIAPEASSLVQPFVYLMAAAREETLHPDQAAVISRAMTIHPSLAELPAWAVDQIREENMSAE